MAGWLHPLQTLDLRAQTTFDYYYIDQSKYNNMPDR